MNTQVAFIALYTYYNVPLRTLHPLIDKIDGVDAHTIFYKNYAANKFNLPTEREEEIFVEVIFDICLTRFLLLLFAVNKI